MTEHPDVWQERTRAALMMAHEEIERLMPPEDAAATWILLHIRAVLFGARGDLTEQEWQAFTRAWETELRPEPLPPLQLIAPRNVNRRDARRLIERGEE